jgi:hypothetical protein
LGYTLNEKLIEGVFLVLEVLDGVILGVG